MKNWDDLAQVAQAALYDFDLPYPGHSVIAEALGKLEAYEDAEKEGRLDIHPCKEGGAVYVLRLYQDHYAEEPYRKIVVYEYQKSMLKDVGKTVFLTREEAEAALKGTEK